MHTGCWWWDTQVWTIIVCRVCQFTDILTLKQKVKCLTKKSGTTIVSIVISSDKTQLTTFHDKTTYSVYLTIENLLKHICWKPTRQGQILLAYLPTSKLKHIKNKAACRRIVANLFYACMGFLLKPLKTLGISGVLMKSGDRAIRNCHPILAAFVDDYPEQVLVTCMKTGDCPICPVRQSKLGDPDTVGEPCELKPILDALDMITEGPTQFTRSCQKAGIKPIQHPFWECLPFLNIFWSITPDILHQLYQENIKHIVAWLKQAYGEAEIDACCCWLPPNHNIQLFLKGISHLNHVTGTKHDQICCFLLGIIIEVQTPIAAGWGAASHLVWVVCGMLDFLYLAKYPIHTTETLDQLEKALEIYHENRDIFIKLGIQNNFNFPKDYFTNHYHVLIKLLGIADNFNTEYMEWLHINMAKDAFCATNSKDKMP